MSSTDGSFASATPDGADGIDSRWDGLLQVAPVGMFLVTAAGIFLRVNAQFERLAGLSREAILGTSWLAHLHPDDRQRVTDEWQAATGAGDAFRSEFRLRQRGGGPVTSFIGEAKALPREQGETPTWIGTLTDLSWRMGQERRPGEELALKLAADNAADLQVLLAVESGGRLRVDFVNQRFMRMAEQWRPGITAADLLGKSRDEAVGSIGFPQDLIDDEWKQYELVLAAGKRVTFEAEVAGPRGVFHQQTALAPVRNERGELTHILWTSRDVTAQREAEEVRRTGDLAFDSSSDMHALLKVEPGRKLRFLRSNQRHRDAVLAALAGRDVPDRDGQLREEWLTAAGFEREAIDEESAYYWQAIDGRTPIQFEWTVETPAGPMILDTLISPVLNEAGECTHVLWTARDVTARRQSEEMLRVGDMAFEHASEMLALLKVEPGRQLRFVRANRQHRASVRVIRPDGVVPEIAGTLRQEWLAEIGLPREFIDTETEHHWEAIDGGVPVRFEWTAEAPQGRITLETVLSPVVDESGECTHVLWSGRDVTGRRRAEEELAASRESMNQAQAIAHMGSWTLDLVTNYLTWSDEIYRIFELDPEEFDASYEGFLNAIHPEDRELVNQTYTSSVELKQPYAIGHRLLMPDGRIKHVLEQGQTSYAEDGTPLRSVGTVQDLTERVLANQRIEESEALFRGTFEQAAVGMILADLRGNIQLVNHRFAEITGYDVEELASRNLTDLRMLSANPNEESAFRDVFSGHRSSHSEERPFSNRDGASRWVNLTVSSLKERDRPGRVLIVLEDITDRKLAEEARRRSEAALAEAERMAAIGSWEADFLTGQVRFSPEMYRWYGITPEQEPELDFERVGDLGLERVHPDDRDAYRSPGEQLLEKNDFGSRELEYRFLDSTGEYRLMRSVVEMTSEGGGSLPRARGFLQDVTEQRRAAERITAQLQEKEVLLREIHHRVKNNLQVVSSLLFLQQQRTGSEEVLEVLRESSNRVSAMALVHEKLYSSEDLAVVEFRDYARELARSLFVSYGVDTGRVRLTVKGAGFVLPLDRAIPAALIVNETVSNALKHAFPGDRSGEVSIRLIERSDSYVIEITDDGVGIPPDRAQTGGTLGTRLIRRLASQMGATIEQTGPGTVYRLTLPKENGE